MLTAFFVSDSLVHPWPGLRLSKSRCTGCAVDAQALLVMRGLPRCVTKCQCCRQQQLGHAVPVATAVCLLLLGTITRLKRTQVACRTPVTHADDTSGRWQCVCACVTAWIRQQPHRLSRLNALMFCRVDLACPLPLPTHSHSPAPSSCCPAPPPAWYTPPRGLSTSHMERSVLMQLVMLSRAVLVPAVCTLQ